MHVAKISNLKQEKDREQLPILFLSFFFLGKAFVAQSLQQDLLGYQFNILKEELYLVV